MMIRQVPPNFAAHVVSPFRLVIGEVVRSMIYPLENGGFNGKTIGKA